MITVPRMANVLRQVFEKDARALARSMGVIQRERKLNGSTLLLLLVLGWLHQPKAGPSALARFAGTVGVTISKQGIEEHWTFNTAEWLYEVLLRAVQGLISAKEVAIPLVQRFAGVYIEDGSSIRLPDGLERYWRGCRGGNAQEHGTKAAVKLTLRLELKQGTRALAAAARWPQSREQEPLAGMALGERRLVDRRSGLLCLSAPDTVE